MKRLRFFSVSIFSLKKIVINDFEEQQALEERNVNHCWSREKFVHDEWRTNLVRGGSVAEGP